RASVAASIPVPAAAPDLTTLAGAGSGKVTGNRTGSFAYASFYYPGDCSTTRVTMTYSPNDVNTNNGFGINIYEFGKLAQSLHGAGTSPGSTPGVSFVDYSTRDFKGTAVIQIFNYNPSGEVTYSLA